MSARMFFSKEEQQKIVAAIKEAELNTSGEMTSEKQFPCENKISRGIINQFERNLLEN